MCWVLVVGIVVVHLILHQQPPAAQVNSHYWQQPTALDLRYPHKLSSGDWEVNFSAVEPWLLQLPLSEHHGLQVNAATLTVMEKLLGRGAIPADPMQQQRFYFLISRALPAPASDEFIDLLTRYSAYRDALATLPRSQAEDVASTIMQQHLKQQQLRARYFNPDHRQALFSAANKAQTYLIERLTIFRDTTLSDEVKKQRLKALDIQYDNQH